MLYIDMTTGIVYSTFIDQDRNDDDDDDVVKSFKGDNRHAGEGVNTGGSGSISGDSHHDVNGDVNNEGDYNDSDNKVTRLHHREWFVDEKHQVMAGMLTCSATSTTIDDSINNNTDSSIHESSSSSSSTTAPSSTTSISSCLHAAVTFKRSHDPELTPDLTISLKPLELTQKQMRVWSQDMMKTYRVAVDGRSDDGSDGDGYNFSRPFNYDNHYDHSSSGSGDVHDRDGDRIDDNIHLWDIHSYHVDITLQSSIDKNTIIPSTVLCGAILCIHSPSDTDTGASTTDNSQLNDNLLICNVPDRIFFLLSLGSLQRLIF